MTRLGRFNADRVTSVCLVVIHWFTTAAHTNNSIDDQAY